MIETATREIAGVIEFDVPAVPPELVQPVGIALTRDDRRAVVPLGRLSKRVAEVDPRSFAVRRHHRVGQRVRHLALSPDERQLHTANGNSGDVTVFDLRTDRPVRSIATGRAPWGVVAAR